MPGKIISVATHKGGAGKTTLSVNLAAGLAKYYKKVALCDFDPQSNASWWLNASLNYTKPTISDLLEYAREHDIEADDATRSEYDNVVRDAAYTVYEQENGRVDLFASSMDLADTKTRLNSQNERANFAVMEAMRRLAEHYDLVILDTPPSIELLTFAPVASSDYVIIPIQLDSLAIKGAQDVIYKILPVAKKYYNPKVRLLGIVVNMFSANKISSSTLEDCQELFKPYLFGTIIRRSVRIGELPTAQRTLIEMSPKSNSAKEYELLSDEVQRRIVDNG